MVFNKSDISQVTLFPYSDFQSKSKLSGSIRILDNEYFYEHYETDNIDDIYNSMFSVIIFSRFRNLKSSIKT